MAGPAVVAAEMSIAAVAARAAFSFRVNRLVPVPGGGVTACQTLLGWVLNPLPPQHSGPSSNKHNGFSPLPEGFWGAHPASGGF